MKENIINSIIQRMLPLLDNSQLKHLQIVLTEELSEQGSKDEQTNIIEIFLAAKRIEGCSEKTISYYKMTIKAM